MLDHPLRVNARVGLSLSPVFCWLHGSTAASSNDNERSDVKRYSNGEISRVTIEQQKRQKNLNSFNS
jgi:hypothetical protein